MYSAKPSKSITRIIINTMNFYQVRQYTDFPRRDPHLDLLIKSFELLEQAQNFAIAHNIQTDKYGRYIIGQNMGYYVMEIKDPIHPLK